MLLNGDIGRLDYSSETFSGDTSVVIRDGSLYRVNGVNMDNTVLVKTASDLSGTLDSSKVYYIDGDIDMGTTQIKVPEGGLYIISDDPDIKGLYSTADNYTMFIVDPSGSYAGGVRMRLMHLQCSGTNSKIFDLDNDSNNGSFEFTAVNFGGFTSATGVTNLGDVTDYRQLFFDGCGFYNIIDGFTLNGTFSGAVFQASNVINTVNDLNTLVEEGTSLIIQGSLRVTSFNFNSVNSDAIFTDIDEDNLQTKGGFSLNDFRTTADDAIPNIRGFSTYARFRNNNGVKNTYVGGQYTITTAATTNITAADTPTKMAGTTAESDLQWFTDDGGTNNRLLYDGDQTIEVEAKGVVSLSGGANDQAAVYFRQWDDSASTFIDAPFATATLNGGLLGTRAEGVPFFGYFTLNNGDYIEVWMQNLSDTTNIEAEVGGLFSVTERPS